MGTRSFFIGMLFVGSLLHAESVLDIFSRYASNTVSGLQSMQKAVQQKIVHAWLASYRKTFNYQNEIARVRVGNTIGKAEQSFRFKREPIIRIGLGKLLGREVTENQVPTIGLCMSGGGYRAMLLSMSFMVGLQSIGMLDASMYAVGLSGSTWSLLYWLASGKTSRDALNTLIKTAGRGQILPVSEWHDVVKVILTKISYEETVTIVDVWGAYLAQQILSDVSDQQSYVFSQLAPRVASGQVPFPIGTAISNTFSSQYEWFECSPFEFGSTFLKAWIPTWAAGRTFNNGVSTNAVPEQTLGFWLGVFGSAFAVSISDIINNAPAIANDTLMNHYIKPIIKPIKNTIGSPRVFTGGKIPNFTYGLREVPINAHAKHTLELVDAGFTGNLPVAPLLRSERALDIIILCDASSPIDDSTALKRAQRYAQKHNLTFPSIDYKGVGTRNVSVFGNPLDPTSLVLIYIPRVNNPSLPAPYGSFDMDKAASLTGFAATAQVRYSIQDAQLMTGYFERNVAAQKEVIKNVVEQRLKALNR